jgi:signal transduction histidine kinase
MQEINFTPKARLIKILGEQLIKDATVGIIELVKNAYDADATKVSIVMQSLNTRDAKIIISDNGTGMSLKTFTDKWMYPAIGHKEEQKEQKIRTVLGRLPLGEKGVGRFATQQIGDSLHMISKTIETKQELFVEIDWSKFDDGKKNLNEINVRYQMRATSSFKPNKTGTILEITRLKSGWSKNEIEKISNTLRRMKSPFNGVNNFDVILKFKNCPDEFEKYENLDTTDILDKAHYTFNAVIRDNGKITYDYQFKMPRYKTIEIYNETSNIFKETKENYKPDTPVGEFQLKLHVYDKSPDKIKASGIVKRDIDEWSGVSVYRDGIRIMPYGEKGNDWLKLDNRRIQQPGRFIGNDQVIGMIEINQDSNFHLKDKTNREGLIENEYYENFYSLIMGTITIFESLIWDSKKTVLSPKKKTSNEQIEAKVTEVKNNLSTVKKKVEETGTEAVNEATSILNKVEQHITEVTQQVTDTIDELEKDKQILFNLAGTGLAAERFTHEFARLVNGGISSLERLKKHIDINVANIKKETDTLNGIFGSLRNNIRLLGPMFYIKRVEKEKDLDIRKIIQDTISLEEQFLEKARVKIDVTGGTFSVTMRTGSCMQIFDNLIDNAIFWCSEKSEQDKRRIKIIIDEKEKTVYVSDSGPGIVARYLDKIFEPFFSMKGELGRGLGLFIVKEILDEKGFGIYFVTDKDYKGLLLGASFKIVFNKYDK